MSALFRPSNAHRWMHCTASVAALAAATEVEEEPSFFAAQGTLAHEMMARMIRREFHGSGEDAPKVGERLEAQGLQVEYDHEMIDALAEVEAYLRILEPSIILSELPTLFNAGYDVPGTADAVAWNLKDDTRLHVIDLKYGQGVRVSAELNPQLMLYALGALESYACLFDGVQKVTLHIMQPRLGSYSTATYWVTELLAWADNVVSRAIQEATSDSAEFRPSDSTCRFCPLMPCKAAMNAVVADFDFLKAKDYALGEESLSAFLDSAPFYERVISATREHARDKLIRGEPVEGWKLVAGRKRRSWKDAAEVESLTYHLQQSATHSVKLNTPSAMEKSIGRSQFRELGLQEWVTSTPGAPTMVPDSDPRPQWVEAEPSDFENVEETES